MASQVVAFPLQPVPLAAPRYFVHRGPLVVQVQRALHKLTAGDGIWSVTLPVGEAGTSVFDLVLLPLVPTALQEVRYQVLAGTVLRRALADLAPARTATVTSSRSSHASDSTARGDHELSFVSLPTQIDPDRPVCPVICLRLAAVRVGAVLVNEIIKLPQARRKPSFRLVLGGMAGTTLILIVLISVLTVGDAAPGRPGIATACFGPRPVCLTDDPLLPWLSHYREHADRPGEVLWQGNTFGRTDCVAFRRYVVCPCSDPRVQGTPWQFEPLELGARLLPRGLTPKPTVAAKRQQNFRPHGRRTEDCRDAAREVEFSGSMSGHAKTRLYEIHSLVLWHRTPRESPHYSLLAGRKTAACSAHLSLAGSQSTGRHGWRDISTGCRGGPHRCGCESRSGYPESAASCRYRAVSCS